MTVLRGIIFIVVFIGVMAWCRLPIYAAYSPVTAGNVGIGTNTPQGGFVVTNGNVGIGTWAPRFLVEMSRNLPTSPFVIDTNGNVGVGTVQVGTAGLTVMNGKVGIGTWVPDQVFQINDPSKAFSVDINGNVGIGTSNPRMTGLVILNGALGIGTWTGIQSNSVNFVGGGYVNNQGLFMNTTNATITNIATSGGTSLNGFGGSASNAFLVLTSTGHAAPSGDYSAYYIGNSGATEVMRVTDNGGTAGNVGIGLTAPKSAFSVVGNVGIGTGASTMYALLAGPTGGMMLQGNLGIGTWTAAAPLIVNGNVGISTLVPGPFNLEVNGTVRVNNANSIGWTVVAGANTACTTTCVSGAVVGFDTGGNHMVGTSDATADKCLCAGAN